MTDGIIQKVFSRERIRIGQSIFNGVKYKNSDISQLYDKIEQELIEEIKKIVEWNCTHSLGVCRECRLLGKVLIGDNE